MYLDVNPDLISGFIEGSTCCTLIKKLINISDIIKYLILFQFFVSERRYRSAKQKK